MDGLNNLVRRTRKRLSGLAIVRWAWATVNSSFRGRERTLRQAYESFHKKNGRALGYNILPGGLNEKRVLIAGCGFLNVIGMELGLIKGLEAAGFSPILLLHRNPWFIRFYRLAGVRHFLFWDDFIRPVSLRKASEALERVRFIADLLSIEHAGVRVGRFTAATALRQLRAGSLDFSSYHSSEQVRLCLSKSMEYAQAAGRIIAKVKPDSALFVDRGYTPQGELFDVCLANGVDSITWNAGHKSNTLMLKRYRMDNRDEHPFSLSEDTWRRLRDLAWTETHRLRLYQELYNSYASGDWYSEEGTQFHKLMLQSDEVRQRVKLDPEKKTAIIFPPILWDGSFFWGQDLFAGYEDWLIETIKIAYMNSNVNWIIKVHPSNLIKDARDGVLGEPAEMRVMHEHFGELPPHIFVIPADTDISTFSLFGLADYCVTVRGTVGIEAATFGIPVFTAGTGRYDHKGFTVDSESREEYLTRLNRIHEQPALSPEQQELAERYAYGVFVMRPLPLTTVTLEFEQDKIATGRTQINVRTKEDWLKATDVSAIARWVCDRGKEDFLADLLIESHAKENLRYIGA